MPPKKKTAPTPAARPAASVAPEDAAAAPGEVTPADAAAAEVADDPIVFDYAGERFTITRDATRRTGVVIGFRLDDGIMVVEALLGEQLVPFVRRHLDEDIGVLFRGFIAAYGQAIAVPNSLA